jgi:hypothetical protein
MNFGNLHYFLGIKTIEKQFKIAGQCWAEISLRLQHMARRPTTCGRLVHGLAAQSNLEGSTRVGRAAAWSPRAARARDGAVARSLAAL